MRTIAIIQARTNSTRLPNKVNLPLAGKTMVQNVFERVNRATMIDDTYIAWPGQYDCDQNDVLKRLLLCAELYKADRIIRVCADNPCVMAEEIDRVAGHSSRPFLLNSTAEYPLADHDGFGGELYTMDMLEWMDKHLASHSSYREHPHKLWVDMSRFYYIGKSYPTGFRLDVNTLEEYKKLKDIFDYFGHNHFTVEEVIEYLKQKNLEERHISQ